MRNVLTMVLTTAVVLLSSHTGQQVDGRLEPLRERTLEGLKALLRKDNMMKRAAGEQNGGHYQEMVMKKRESKKDDKPKTKEEEKPCDECSFIGMKSKTAAMVFGAIMGVATLAVIILIVLIVIKGKKTNKFKEEQREMQGEMASAKSGVEYNTKEDLRISDAFE